MVTSDNGGRLTDFEGRDHGHWANGVWRGGKADIWDGGHREPFAAMWPAGIAAGSTCDHTFCLSDIFATLAEIVGWEIPMEAAEDSFSFLGALKGDRAAEPPRRSVVHHSSRGMFSLRREEWKYIEGVGSGGFTEPAFYDPKPGEPKGQLYRIAWDQREALNLWSKEQDKVEELRQELVNIRSAGRSR